MAVHAVYIHIPFCIAKCYYCDFASYPGLESLHQDYVVALATDIYRTHPRGSIDTVYIGGGTPTVLSGAQLTAVLSDIQGRFRLAADAEITVEANPGTVDPRKLELLRQAGFNRISLGIQALSDATLIKLGRIHTTEQAVAAYYAARATGFENIGIDLMYALPGQSLSDWQSTLERAVMLRPEHASLYELSIEEGTKFAELCAAGEMQIPDEDVRVEMFESAIKVLTAAGYEHYEVSNFARPGYRSRHNQVYWRNESYFGFGAGAVRYIDGVRCTMTKSVERYICDVRAGRDAIESCEQLAGAALMGETVMLALRTSDGVDLQEFQRRFGVPLMDVYGNTVRSFIDDGLMEISLDRLRLTHRGLLLANRVSAEFVEA